MHQQQKGSSMKPTTMPTSRHSVECGKSEMKKVHDRKMMSTKLITLHVTHARACRHTHTYTNTRAQQSQKSARQKSATHGWGTQTNPPTRA